MRNFTFLIGSMDDFDSAEDLVTAWQSGDHEFSSFNTSVYYISLSEECKVDGCPTLACVAVEIGRGRAATDGWFLDETFSCLTGE
jgi:hypothetical protein